MPEHTKEPRQSRMIRRVPRFAETKFENLCAIAGALCHQAEEDESGWDYFVEFPAQHPPGPADTHPPPKSAFVQVKSVRQYRLTRRVKLSNALRAAQSPHPWFVVLVIANARNEPARLYGVHVWKDLIRLTLEKVRWAETDKVPLHKRYFTIRFDASAERGDNLLAWMHDAIEVVGPDYEQQKKTIFQTIGYEEGYGIAQVTFEPATGDEVLENFLGLGSGISLSRFVYTPARFGILSPEPERAWSSGVLHITPDPVTVCELRLRGPSAASPMVLSGHVYSPGIPGLSFEQSRLRFSTDFLEIVWTPGGKADCRMNFGGQEKKGLITIENFCTLIVWWQTGPVEAQIWLRGRRTICGAIPVGPPNMDLDWARVAKIVRLLRSIAGPVEESEIQLSLADLNSAAPDLIAFQELVEAPSLRVEFEPSSGTPPTFSSLLYYFYADVCECTFYALLERPIREDIVIEGRRRVTCGLPQLREGYVLRNATQDERGMMQDDYERHLHKQEETGIPLGLGDAHVFL
jgi:hypothetical protein